MRDTWRLFAESGLSTTLHEGPYRPHVTLAVYESVDLDVLTPSLRELVRQGACPSGVAGS
jgi:hypothetical protein